jgi:hypothetical protein
LAADKPARTIFVDVRFPDTPSLEHDSKKKANRPNVRDRRKSQCVRRDMVGLPKFPSASTHEVRDNATLMEKSFSFHAKKCDDQCR